MAKIAIRGLRYRGVRYLRRSDVLVWLAAFGELPALSEEQRLVVEAMLLDMRRAGKMRVQRKRESEEGE